LMAIGLPSPSLELQMCNDSEDSPPIVSREITATTAPCELSVNAARKSERDAARQSLDELFTLARRYKSSKAYSELIRFIAKFWFYAPFNAMLVHIQKPGARYVAPPHRWLSDYHRRIKAEAQPLVILQPMGPVMFVFDVSETEPEKDAPPLPTNVERPFDVRQGHVKGELWITIENAKRDGISVGERKDGSQRAGSIEIAKPGQYLTILVKQRPAPEYLQVPLRYKLILNSSHSAETKYATLVHELAHLYCGHLGTPNERWWSDRAGVPHEVQEFEAESICYLVCKRLGIDNPSATYLANYLKENKESDVPAISLECVMKSAGLIEQMGRGRLKPRKERE
jgi:IrrE N-terminal-like domain